MKRLSGAGCCRRRLAGAISHPACKGIRIAIAWIAVRITLDLRGDCEGSARSVDFALERGTDGEKSSGLGLDIDIVHEIFENARSSGAEDFVAGALANGSYRQICSFTNKIAVLRLITIDCK